jgi:carbon-monoxide dehydrogenase large subunit
MVTVHDDFARPAGDRHVRFVGGAIVAVVAETASSEDAADMGSSTTTCCGGGDMEDALGSARRSCEAHGSNVAISSTDPVDDDLFGDAEVIVRGRYVNQRIAVAPMEPHGAASAIDPDGRLLVYGSTQMPHLLHNLMARALGVDKSEIRVITPLVGGGFGGKAGIYPEQVVVAALAKRLQRPVVWAATRSEDMVALSRPARSNT